MTDRRRTLLLGVCVSQCLFSVVCRAERPTKPVMAGLSGPVGAPPGARVVRQLRIDRPGLYENIIVDGRWADADLVRIRADNVVLRNCTIRFGRRDAVEVYARNVLIANCKIHHVLAGTFSDQRDAHGITGRPLGLTVRNCEIAYVSGDGLQFDPSRKNKPYPWDNVLVEHCFLWTGPLPADAAGFKKGQRPGENAFDSKTHPDQPRARITFRATLAQGWGHGQIVNGAAMNFKEKIQAVVDNCVLVDNDIGFRCRGTRGSAWASVRNCSIYRTTRPFRLEDRVQNIRVFHAAYGPKVGKQIFQRAGGGSGPGFMDVGRRQAPPLPPWPYDRVPVGKTVPPDRTPQARDQALPTKQATGFDPAAFGRPLTPRPGGGKSLAAEMFSPDK